MKPGRMTANCWPRVEENDSEWNEFVRNIEELGRKIQKAREDDPNFYGYVISYTSIFFTWSMFILSWLHLEFLSKVKRDNEVSGVVAFAGGVQ